MQCCCPNTLYLLPPLYACGALSRCCNLEASFCRCTSERSRVPDRVAILVLRRARSAVGQRLSGAEGNFGFPPVVATELPMFASGNHRKLERYVATSGGRNRGNYRAGALVFRVSLSTFQAVMAARRQLSFFQRKQVWQVVPALGRSFQTGPTLLRWSRPVQFLPYPGASITDSLEAWVGVH